MADPKTARKIAMEYSFEKNFGGIPEVSNPLTEKDKLLMLRICSENGLEFEDLQETGRRPTSEEQITNHSFSTSTDIYLGLYEDRELKIASFFHELGHCLDSKDLVEKNTEKYPGVYQQEANAWCRGFEESGKYGFSFKGETLAWCFNQLKTYEKYVS